MPGGHRFSEFAFSIRNEGTVISNRKRRFLAGIVISDRKSRILARNAYRHFFDIVISDRKSRISSGNSDPEMNLCNIIFSFIMKTGVSILVLLCSR